MNTKEFHIQTGFLKRELIVLKTTTLVENTDLSTLTEVDMFTLQSKDLFTLLQYFSTITTCMIEVRQTYQVLEDFRPLVVYKDTDLLNTMLSNGVPIFLSHIDCFKKHGFTFMHTGLSNYLVQNDNYFFVWSTCNYLVLMETGVLIQVKPSELPMSWEKRLNSTITRTHKIHDNDQTQE